MRRKRWFKYLLFGKLLFEAGLFLFRKIIRLFINIAIISNYYLIC